MARLILVIIVALAAFCEVCCAAPGSDEEVRRRIVGYMKPKCGGNMTPGVVPRRSELIDRLGLGGDTNHLARILAELAQTNDAWYAEMAMKQLEKYATSEQLQFLYSCATNPAVGDKAVKAVLRIEGITSNSVDAAQRYFMLSNVEDRFDQSRTSICADLITMSNDGGVDINCRSNALEVAGQFSAGPYCNAYWLDVILINRDQSYRNSKRRLAALRSSAAYAAQWSFISNYVANAISELVAYPEANLPD